MGAIEEVMVEMVAGTVMVMEEMVEEVIMGEETVETAAGINEY
jgi:hypothetical protein